MVKRSQIRRALLSAAVANRSWSRQVMVGLFVFFVVVGLLLFLEQFGQIVDYSFALGCVVVASVWGGFLSGLTTAMLSALWIDYFYTEPSAKNLFGSMHDGVRVAVYVGITMLVSAIMQMLRSAFQEMDNARNEALTQSHARENIVEIIAHDLKNPISAILLNVTLVMKIAERKNWDDNSIPKLRKTARVALKMGQTISDLMLLAEIEFEKFKIKPSVHPITELVQKLYTWDEVERVDASVPSLEIRTLNEDVQVDFDLDQSLRAISAILAVLFEMVPSEMTVRIVVASIAHGIEVKISAPGSMLQLFEAADFFKKYRSAERVSRPAQMKISLAKGIVKMHCGQLNVVEVEGHTQISLTFMA